LEPAVIITNDVPKCSYSPQTLDNGRQIIKVLAPAMNSAIRFKYEQVSTLFLLALMWPLMIVIPKYLADGRKFAIRLLKEGDVVTLTTTDRISKPLPDPMLLRLRSYVTWYAFTKAAGQKVQEVWEEEWGEGGEAQAQE
jgi:hypothetical protein